MAASTDAEATDSLSTISNNISINFLPNHQQLVDRILKRSLYYYTQSYIHDIRVYPKNSTVKVVAKCWKLMRKSEKPHSLHIELMADQIEDSHCSCKIGLTGHCTHVIVLVMTLQGLKLHNIANVPAQMSCTSMPQQWHVPRGEKIQPVPINHLVVTKPTEDRRRKPVLCQLDTSKSLPQVTENDIRQLKKA